jgi:hypothetical protein
LSFLIALRRAFLAACAFLADLQQELAVLRELQDVRVGAAVAANPDVALVVDEDAMVGIRPLVSLARPAPVAQQVPFLIELENRRRARAAFALLGFERLLVVAERGGAPMDDPHVIVGVDPHANRRAEDPVIGQRLRPQRIHFEARRLHGSLVLRSRGAFEHELRDTHDDQQRDHTRAGNEAPIARHLPHVRLL